MPRVIPKTREYAQHLDDAVDFHDAAHEFARLKDAALDTVTRQFGFASAGVTVFELARVMGTSVAMIERHYGTLLDGAHAGLVGRLDSIEATLEEATRRAASD